MRLHHLELADAVIVKVQGGEGAAVEAPLPHSHAGADHGAHHAVAEGIRLDGGDNEAVVVAVPAKVLHRANGRRARAWLAVGRKVVQADQGRRSRLHRGKIEFERMPCGAQALLRVAQGERIGDAVLIAAPHGREPGVETAGYDRGPAQHDVGLGHEDPAEATQDGGAEIDRGAISGAALDAHQGVGLFGGEVEMGDLPAGVHPGIRSAGDDQGGVRGKALQDAGEPVFDVGLHGAKARLAGPAGEIGAVVGEVEPDARGAERCMSGAGHKKSHEGKPRWHARVIVDGGLWSTPKMSAKEISFPMPRSPLSFPFTERTRSTTAAIGPENAPVLGPRDAPGIAPSGGRLAGLDGLRALAVIAVVLYHFFPAILPGGFIGVDVFFVISGFLITGLLVSEHTRTGRISLGRFWQRRARRLVPPLIPVILISCTLAFLIDGDVLVGLGAQLLGATTFGYNWVSIANDASYFSVNEPELLRNLWSLAVEEQFYLVWPLLLLAVLLIRRPRVRLALVIALFLASALWMGVLYQPGADPTRVYYGSDTHSFGLFAGAALALLLRRPSDKRDELPRVRPWLGAAAVLAIIAFALWLPEDGAATYRGGLVAVSLATAVAIWAGVRGGRFGRLLDATPLRYLGERSYGIYLWHWPVLVLVQLLWPTSSPFGSLLPIGLLTAVITLTLAGASYRWLEMPIRRVGVRGTIRRVGALWTGPTRRRRLVAATAVLSVLLVGGTTAAVVAAPAQTSAQSRIERGQRAMDAAARATRVAAAEAARQATAAPALTDGPITAIGDSVMLASAPELQATFAGMTIDASVSRGMYSADEIVLALKAAGQLQPVVVIGLGTNGPITVNELTKILSVLGPHRQLVLVNAYAERDWTDGVNTTLAEFAAGNRRVELANWHDTIAGRLDLLAGDHVHPGPTGGQLYADEVRAALVRLAAVPPLPDTSWLLRNPDAPRPPPHR